MKAGLKFEEDKFYLIKFRDHYLFDRRRKPPERPIIYEVCGMVDYQDKECIRVIWSWDEEEELTGLIVLRASIIEAHVFGKPVKLSPNRKGMEV